MLYSAFWSNVNFMVKIILLSRCFTENSRDFHWCEANILEFVPAQLNFLWFCIPTFYNFYIAKTVTSWLYRRSQNTVSVTCAAWRSLNTCNVGPFRKTCCNNVNVVYVRVWCVVNGAIKFGSWSDKVTPVHTFLWYFHYRPKFKVISTEQNVPFNSKPSWCHWTLFRLSVLYSKVIIFVVIATISNCSFCCCCNRA